MVIPVVQVVQQWPPQATGMFIFAMEQPSLVSPADSLISGSTNRPQGAAQITYAVTSGGGKQAM